MLGRSVSRIGAWAAVCVVASCGGGSDTGATSPEPEVVFLEPTDHLVRASMVVRGIRPSVDELEQVAANPGALDGIVDAYLESDEFGAFIRDLHAELYLLRADTTFQLPVKGYLVERGYDQDDLHHSTVEAPLRFVEEVIREDRPYTEILTADYAYANEVVADIYGLPFNPDGPEWQHSRWTDGRPHAGLLSDSEIWRRHVSNAQNFHRARANFVSHTFLCEDIGARDVIVEGGVALNDPFEVAAAVQTQPSCIGCHQVLDPLAALFWGYKEQLKRGAINEAYRQNCEWDWDNGDPPRGSYRIDHWCYPLRFYVASDESLWDFYGLREPGYFGTPLTSMTDLGYAIAEDPRFAQCTARTFYSYMGQVERLEIPLETASALQDVLVESDFDIKTLVKTIVLSEDFRIDRVMNNADESVFAPSMQTIRPEQFARTLQDLTGFVWLANQDKGGCEAGGNNCWNDVDLLNSDLFGFRSMQGGIDGYTVTHPTHTATPTKLLSMAMAADEAAGWVVENDFNVPPESRKLLALVEVATTDEAVIRDQLAWLHKRILGEMVGPNDPAVDLSYGLWADSFDRNGDALTAWKMTLSALMQDPRMVFY